MSYKYCSVERLLGVLLCAMVVGMLALGLDFVPVTKAASLINVRPGGGTDGIVLGMPMLGLTNTITKTVGFSSTMGDGGTTNIGGAPLPVDLTGTKRIEIVYNYSGLSGTGTLLFGFRLSDDTYVLPGSVPPAQFPDGQAVAQVSDASTFPPRQLRYATWRANGGSVYLPKGNFIVLKLYDTYTSTITLTSSPNPCSLGQAVTFTGTIVYAGSGTPSGMVTFKEGTTILGTASLSGGVATFITSTFSIGTHNITAEYSGDSDFDPSISPELAQVIQKPTAVVLSTFTARAESNDVSLPIAFGGIGALGLASLGITLPLIRKSQTR